MHSRTLAILVAVLVLAFATVVVASLLAGSDQAPTHTMPDGGSMQNDDMR